MPISYCDEAGRDVDQCEYVIVAERQLEALKAAMIKAVVLLGTVRTRTLDILDGNPSGSVDHCLARAAADGAREARDVLEVALEACDGD